VFAALWGMCILAIGASSAMAQPASPDEGMRVFKSANCVGCHKWSGIGGGGYGGAAANLRQTALSMEEIEQTVRCGRPGTGMPHFEADAYSDGHCYGLKAADLADGKMPPEPDHSLRPSEIQAVVTYVVTHVKGKGEPDLAQCQAFFGTGTRVCDIYEKPEGTQATATPQPASAEASAPGSGPPPHGHLKVDAASDANSPNNSGRK
jgi:Cytochrome C oxidase, cbb3-type, subunit III